MNKRWVIPKHDRTAVAALAAEIGVHPLTAALLIKRGYETAEKAVQFLEPSLDDLHDPLLLMGMERAVARILQAVDRKEKILIWGDYDVDGTTGTVLLRQALKILQAETRFHIPNRFLEGYGVNIPGLEDAKAEGCTVAITVDCGIRSFEPAEWARSNGMDLVITDHHLSDESCGKPDAFAIVNPNQAGCKYPDKRLAGVGVAFKLAHALLRERGHENLVGSFLKMAAIGTVADVMDLTGENRAIVALGLRDLRGTNNYGLKALMEVSDCRSEMTSYHIGYRIGPRINAAGRMDAGRQVIELFECSEFSAARKIAGILDSHNRKRQEVQEKITELAMVETQELGRRNFVVVSGNKWHRGVVGLAASRLAEKFYRPTVVLSVDGEIAHGSARSIPGFHVLGALESCSYLFEQFGGHAAAAGLTMKSENIPELRARLDMHAGDIFADTEPVPELHIDAPVSAETMTLAMLDQLAKLEPFGVGNRKPVFVTKGLVISGDPLVMKEKHLKLRLATSDRRHLEAVWWNGVEHSKGRTLAHGSRIEVAYTAEANVWQGNTRLQLVIEDIRSDN